MHKRLAPFGAVQPLVVSMMCKMAVTCAAEQYGFPNALLNTATLSRALSQPQGRTTQVVAGMKIELALAPRDEHVYTAQLENGALNVTSPVKPTKLFSTQH